MSAIAPGTTMRVHMVETATGERRVYETACHYDDLDGVEFVYTEGNWACDCNRSDDWRRAAGDTSVDTEGGSGFCLGHGRYLVPLIEFGDGQRLEIDKAP